jgi:hypothetical protein
MRLFVIVFFLLLSFECFSKTEKTTFNVTVTVPEPNTAPPPKKEPRDVELKDGKIIKKDLSDTTSTVIEKTDMSCCYCTKKYSDGTYIDENHTAYLFDRKTNTFAINNLNKDKGYAIACPDINWGKPKKNSKQ